MKEKHLDVDEEDFYDGSYLEEALEDDQINAEEEGFMAGYISS